MTKRDLTILPCPFCGREPYIEGSGEGRSGLMIHCVTQTCVNPSVSYYNHDIARAVWNRREGVPPLTPPPDSKGAT